MPNYYHPQTMEHIRNPLPAVVDWAGITNLEPPTYDPQAESCRFVEGAWVVEVNVPPALTKADYQIAIQNLLDATAQADDWDNINNAVAASGVPMAVAATTEALLIHSKSVALAQWYFSVWGMVAKIESEVLAGTRVQLSPAELVAEMPSMIWP